MSKLFKLIQDIGEPSEEEIIELSSLYGNIFNWFNNERTDNKFVESLIFNSFMYKEINQLFEGDGDVIVQYEPSDQLLVYIDEVKDIVFSIDILANDIGIMYDKSKTEEEGEIIMNEAKLFLEEWLVRIRECVSICVSKMKTALDIESSKEKDISIDDKKEPMHRIDIEVNRVVSEISTPVKKERFLSHATRSIHYCDKKEESDILLYALFALWLMDNDEPEVYDSLYSDAEKVTHGTLLSDEIIKDFENESFDKEIDDVIEEDKSSNEKSYSKDTEHDSESNDGESMGTDNSSFTSNFEKDGSYDRVDNSSSSSSSSSSSDDSDSYDSE